MVLSQREKHIAIATVAVLLLFVLYNFVLTPVMDAGDRIESEKERLLTKLEQAQRIFDRRDQLSEKWHEMKSGGLGSDPSLTQTQVLLFVKAARRKRYDLLPMYKKKLFLSTMS